MARVTTRATIRGTCRRSMASIRTRAASPYRYDATVTADWYSGANPSAGPRPRSASRCGEQEVRRPEQRHAHGHAARDLAAGGVHRPRAQPREVVGEVEVAVEDGGAQQRVVLVPVAADLEVDGAEGEQAEGGQHEPRPVQPASPRGSRGHGDEAGEDRRHGGRRPPGRRGARAPQHGEQPRRRGEGEERALGRCARGAPCPWCRPAKRPRVPSSDDREALPRRAAGGVAGPRGPRAPGGAPRGVDGARAGGADAAVRGRDRPARAGVQRGGGREERAGPGAGPLRLRRPRRLPRPAQGRPPARGGHQGRAGPGDARWCSASRPDSFLVEDEA